MRNQVDGFRLSPSSGCTLHRRSYLSPLPRCRVTGDIIMSLSFSQHYKIKINRYYLPVWTCQPSQAGCPLLICNTPMILRLPWALPATLCWSTTSPSAAATLVSQSASSSPSQSPSRDIRCKETLHQLHQHELEHEIGGKKPKWTKQHFLLPRIISGLSQKNLCFLHLWHKKIWSLNLTQEKTQLVLRRKKIEILTKEIQRIILYLNLLKGVLWNLFKSLCFCQYLPINVF